jgi:hypothetical protein
VHLDRVFPLDQAAQAHAHAENGATGKTVLRIADNQTPETASQTRRVTGSGQPAAFG